MSQYESLLAAIGAAPSLPGARCRFRSHLFDEAGPHEAPEITAERHQQAVGLCQHCPSASACETWYGTLTPSRRPPGVIAGKIPRAERPGRPKKAAS